MPKRNDIQKILIIGAGPIIIGQACEFDYSGTQACKALKQEGYEVILVNSNPATIMTDAELAHRTYIEPVTPEVVEKIIKKERPDAILPTMGGQTGLNTALAVAASGVLDKYGVEMIGADVETIHKAEDRTLFKEAMEKIGQKVAPSGHAKSLAEAWEIVKTTGFPAIIRPSFTLGGAGGSIAYSEKEFAERVGWGLIVSPSGTVLIEKSLLGWKEYDRDVIVALVGEEAAFAPQTSGSIRRPSRLVRAPAPEPPPVRPRPRGWIAAAALVAVVAAVAVIATLYFGRGPTPPASFNPVQLTPIALASRALNAAMYN